MRVETVPQYPKNSEYEYLQWSILEDYLIEIAACDRRYKALEANCLLSESSQLWQEHSQARLGIYEKRWRREEILDRLYIDSQLRQAGSTFSECYKQVQLASIGDRQG